MKHFFGVLLVLSTLAWGGAVYRFRDGTHLAASHVNYNLKHLHDSMVGEHGPRLVDGDVSADAGIAFSKLAIPALVPVAWGYFGTCITTADGTDCSNQNDQGLNFAEARVGAAGADGLYTVWLDSSRTDTNYAVIVTPTGGSYSTCYVNQKFVNAFYLDCQEVTGFVDRAFSVLVMDTP